MGLFDFRRQKNGSNCRLSSPSSLKNDDNKSFLTASDQQWKDDDLGKKLHERTTEQPLEDGGVSRHSLGGVPAATFPLSRVFRRGRGGGRRNNNKMDDASPDSIMKALHRACAEKSEVQVVKYLVAKHPDGAKAPKDGNLPLHTACANKPSVEVIQYLIEAFPGATGTRNKRGKLPIHVAVECGASLQVVELLVEKDPESLEVADYDIKTVSFENVWIVHKAQFSFDSLCGLPLHTACKYRASLQVIHHLVKTFPDAARTKNKDGWLPIHFSCAFGGSLTTIQYLLTACPSSLYERTTHLYEYPMHLACGKMNAHIEIVKYIQARHSISVTQTKPNQSLYLTYYDEACLQSAPTQVIAFLSAVCAKARQGYAYVSTVEDPYN